MSGFDLTKALDDTESVSLNLTSMGLTSIYYDRNKQLISASVDSSSTSNVTYTSNNKSVEYKATKVFIIGSKGNTSVNQIIGVDNNIGQLVIKTENTNGDKTLYFCIPMYVSGAIQNAPKTDIDTMCQYALNGSATQLTANFQKTVDFFSNEHTVYIIYTSSINNAKIVTLGLSIPIISTVLIALQNNLNIYNPNPADYTICKPPVPGDWMECDYVDIDSEEVTSYNLPVGSGLVQDNAAYSSLRTMMMYILFIMFTGLSYTLIPHIYIFMLKSLFNVLDVKNPSAQTKQMGNFDGGMLFLTVGLALSFIIVGVISTSSIAPILLLYGVLIGICVLLGHIIITSKKSGDSTWPIGEIQKSYTK